MRPIYEPGEGRKMKVLVLFSGGASALPFMVGGKEYEVIGGISSSKSASGISRFQSLGIPVEVVDIKDFYAGRPIKDMQVRGEYERRLLSVMEEKGWEPDVVACSGYMYVLTPVFLKRFPNRVLNVHPADLSIEEGGRRKYTGLHAVRDQLEAGEKVTRSTVHVMIEEADQGPILVISPPLPVEGRSPEEQQELMKVKCDGPAYREALRLLSEGRFALDERGRTYVRTDGGWKEGYVRMEG
ncbi:MAG: formyltransferase family protein [Candidatus Hadarchaeales archaeon]